MLKKSPLQRLFPTSFNFFYKKKLGDGAGITLLLLTLVIVAVLGSYYPTDPSLNTINSTGIAQNCTVQNWLGMAGAVGADIMMQFFGYSAWLLPFITGGWSLNLLLNRSFKLSKLRIFLAFLAMLSLGIFFNGVLFESNYRGNVVYPGGALSFLLFNSYLVPNLNPLNLNPLALGLIFYCCGGVAILLTGYVAGLSLFRLYGPKLSSLKSFGRLLKPLISKKPTNATKIINNEPYVGFARHPQLIPTDASLRDAKNPESNSLESNSLESNSLESSSWGEFPGQVPKESPGEQYEEPSKQILEENPGKYPEINPGKELLGEGILVNPGSQSNTITNFFNRDFGGDYKLPDISLLDNTLKSTVKLITKESLAESSEQLKNVLREFGIQGEIVNIRPGPVVTMYELQPAAGIKIARVIALADDIARYMSVISARIAVIPGHNVIGIELPNSHRQTVYLRDLFISSEYQNQRTNLPLILGNDIGGKAIIADLTRMPHLLVAGTTGSGKSVSINTMILSLLFKLSPEECKFIMIDPKMIELSVYNDIPHLLTPVVTDAKKAVVALKWAVKEMENRYRSMATLGVRNIDGFNTRLREAKADGEVLVRRVQTGFDPDSGKPVFENQPLDSQILPHIVVIVDEMADLMLVSGKEVEAAVQRLAQMARAAGIHLIMATQRPSVDVITGTIKANFPTRISFQVTSKIDSRTILGEQGAEQLLGAGDMLYMAGGGRITRVHGPLVREDEVEKIVNFVKSQGEPSYMDGVTEGDDDTFSPSKEDNQPKEDSVYSQALELIRRENKVSTSFIQRHLEIGYNRAAKIIDQMERDGVISAANHVGKREILH